MWQGIRILFLFGLALFFASMASAQEMAASEPGWKVYRSQVHKIELMLPSGWVVEDVDDNDMTITPPFEDEEGVVSSAISPNPLFAVLRQNGERCFRSDWGKHLPFYIEKGEAMVIVCRAEVEVYLSYKANEPQKDRTVKTFSKMLESIKKIP